MKTIRIIDVVTVITDVPYDEAHYPKMTLDQAVQVEKDSDPESCWEVIASAVQDEDSFGGKFVQVRQVDVIDDDNGDARSRNPMPDPTAHATRMEAGHKIQPNFITPVEQETARRTMAAMDVPTVDGPTARQYIKDGEFVREPSQINTEGFGDFLKPLGVEHDEDTELDGQGNLVESWVPNQHGI